MDMANNGTGQPLHQLTFLAESHEDRLQKVEENLQDVAVAVGKMQTAQAYMTDQEENNSKAILDKLNGIGTKFDSFETRLTPLELDQKQRLYHKKNIKSFVKAVMLAVGGAICAGAGTWIWELISK